MRALLKKIIIWALASGATDVAGAAAELDKLAAELKK
jgi:hypothetical protein